MRHPDVADSHGLQQQPTRTAAAAPSPELSDGSWATGNRSPYPLSNHSSPQYPPSSPTDTSNSEGWVQRAPFPGTSSMPADSFADFLDGYTADCLDDLFDDTLSRHLSLPVHEHPLSLSAAVASVDPVMVPVGPGSAGSGVSNRRGNARSKAAVGTCTYIKYHH